MFGRGRPRHPDVLTPAEWRVLDLVRDGRSNGEIAVALGLSPNTVKYHVANMLAKLQLPDRQALARWNPPRRAPALGLLGKIGLVASVGAAVVIAAALLAPERPGEAANSGSGIAYVAASAAVGPTLRLLDPATGNVRDLGNLPVGKNVDTIAWNLSGTAIVMQSRRISAAPNCPPFARCPAFLSPATLDQVSVSDSSTTQLASGIEAGTLLGWDDDVPIVAVEPSEERMGTGAVVIDRLATGCTEIAVSTSRAACRWPTVVSDDQWEIRVIERSQFPDFSNPLLTLRPEGYPILLAMSPDGRWLSWNNPEGRYTLRVASLPAPGTSAQSQIVDAGFGSDAKWAPAGGKLLFLRSAPSGDYADIWIYDAATQAEWQVTDGGAHEAAWSPDGSRIAFVSERDHRLGEIYVVNADGTGLERLTFNEEYEAHLAWSP
jgi:DNA-binding CsgD family transcriptional regulator